MEFFKNTFIGRNSIKESISSPNNRVYDPLGVDKSELERTIG